MRLGAAGEATADDVPSAEEVAKLIESAPTAFGRAFLFAGAHTGAREGELLALVWDDIDFDGKRLSIKRSDSWARTRSEREAKTVKGPRVFEPKTAAGRRTIAIDDELIWELRRWRLACPPGRRGLVFPSPTGESLHRWSLYNRIMGPAALKLERRFKVHALRHFHASALLLAGVPIAEVSARLGHKNAAITMRVYTHFIRGAETKAAEIIAGVMRAARGNAA